MGRSVRVAGVSALALLVASGCATPAVLERWNAYDALERVRFSLDDDGKGAATLHWRAESRGLPDRRGEARMRVERLECERLSLRIAGGERVAASTSRWQEVELRGVLERDGEDEGASAVDPCSVLLRFRDWSGAVDPRFELDYRGRGLGEFEVDPARRPGWLALAPVAVVTDVVLAVPILIGAAFAFILPGMDDFSWSPPHDPDWHRRQSDERRKQDGSS